MKRFVFGLAIVGLIVVLAPALLNAGELNHPTLTRTEALSDGLSQLRAEMGELPLVSQSPEIQLVDHCYRRSYRPYGGHHRYRHASPYQYAPRRSYHHGHHYGHYHTPRSHYRGYGGGYHGGGFGLYIGF